MVFLNAVLFQKGFCSGNFIIMKINPGFRDESCFTFYEGL